MDKTSTACRHKSGFMLRLPEIYREQINQLRKKSQRSITDEVKEAVEKHLAEKGLWPPATST